MPARTIERSVPEKTPLIVAGPTGVGKSAFAVELAARFDGEIVGMDACQAYRSMETLTAQPAPDLMARVPHHLIGCMPATEDLNAARFADLAREKMAEISARGRRPVLTGGSGLYLKALTHGLAKIPPADPALRAELASLSLAELQQRLDHADPEARKSIDFHNARRVMRALEIYLLTGRTTAAQRKEWQRPPAFAFQGFLLIRDRDDLDARIVRNVCAMFAQGVVEEVRRLGELRSTAAMAIGWREIQALLREEIDVQQCQAAIILATRRYAKRQLTWFRNQFNFSSINLTNLHSIDEILSGPDFSSLGNAQ